MLVTVIGRGHSGTRAISHTLSASGVFMGCPQNPSGDLLPPEQMYDACRVLAKHVVWKGGLQWDFDALRTAEIPEEFTRLIRSYLRLVRESPAPHRGWKIPETTLVYPWIVRMFPDIKYIFWIRNPCDCVIGAHLTDHLTDFGIGYPPTDDERLRRAISWLYQYDLVKATPRPAHWIEVRLEDFVLRQEETLARLEEFLGLKMARIPVKPEAVDRWRKDAHTHYFDFFEPAMREYGYELPKNRAAVSPKPDEISTTKNTAQHSRNQRGGNLELRKSGMDTSPSLREFLSSRYSSQEDTKLANSGTKATKGAEAGVPSS